MASTTRCITAAIMAAVAVAQAKTPAQLKSDLASIMPAGTKARMVWQQGGTWKSESNAVDIYGVDSDDGVIRKINTTTINAVNPQLTDDGKRIIYHNKRNEHVEVINYEPGGPAPRVVVQNAMCWGYWRSPADGSDWVLVGGDGGTVERVNIDNGQRVVLYNGGKGSEGSPEMGISLDGTRLSGYFENGGGWDPGLVNVAASKSQVTFSTMKGGCGMGMAPDNTYDYFVHWGIGHHAIRLYNGSSPVDSFGLVDDINDWAARNNGAYENDCHDNREFQDAKWTNLRDFVTFSMFNTVANPFIFRLSDGKWIHIYDDIGCTWTHGLDVVFLASGAQQDMAPSVPVVPATNAMLNTPFSMVVPVGGSPLPTLAATGLPNGVILKNGGTPASSFTIAGTPTAAGTYTVNLVASNTAGTAALSFTITVGSQSQPPSVGAGPDATLNLGNDFRLAGTANDDGVPMPLSTTWQQVSGPVEGAEIVAPDALTSQVIFADEGVYLFELSATDGADVVRDTVRVVVNESVPFEIMNPGMGDTIRIGGTTTIAWRIDPPGTAVTIELSTDGGKTYEYLMSNSYYDSVWQWTVGSDLAVTPSNQCIIRVSEYRDRNNFAVSESFPIVGMAQVRASLPIAVARGAAKIVWYTTSGRRLGMGGEETGPGIAIRLRVAGHGTVSKVMCQVRDPARR